MPSARRKRGGRGDFGIACVKRQATKDVEVGREHPAAAAIVQGAGNPINSLIGREVVEGNPKQSTVGVKYGWDMRQ
jgi:hypothetical protein